MMPVAFLVLFILTDGVSSKKVCGYQDILDHLNLTTDNSLFKLTRPVLDHTHPTFVELNIILYAILGVIEKTQTFIPFIWASITWNNEHISWDPAQFCGITQVSVPIDLLWKPDLFIYEMIQKDESVKNPYMYMLWNGKITSEQAIKAISTCQMDIHKFPFDKQSCNISIGSAVHCADELRFLPSFNSSRATQFSREVMKTQGDWEFLQLSISSTNFTLHNKHWEQLIYTFTIKRRPLLHVLNFLLPILFFLSLDLASFFISDHRGEKLGFKVTVLLAISVLLLILNEILPSMSNKTPLIATYCIVIFALMLLNLLVTILVMYLMEKDSQNMLKLKDESEDKQEKVHIPNCNTGDKRQICCSHVCKVPDCEKQHELLPVDEEVMDTVHSRESRVLLLILEELKELRTTLNLHLSCREEGGKLTQWATRINNAFFIFYAATVSLFLCFIFREWTVCSDSATTVRGLTSSVEIPTVFAGMILFLCLLFLTDAACAQENCSYQDVLKYLNLSMNNELFVMTRPVKNYKEPTYVSLELLLYAILDVVEKDQKFIPYVWTVTRWHNDYISWDPNQFCGIDNISVPTEILWKPDLTIEEMTEKDKAPPSPYLTINDKGDVEVQNDQVLVSTCRMHTYNFPFDIQSCNLSFKSVIHTVKDIRLQPSDNSSEATEWSREVMRTQYEWLFINMNVTTNNASDPLGQDIVVYTITMKRRSVLYIVNFLLPVLFFLCLDLASFLISDHGGEKLSFKVTVLLAVTVLQLILNEILPSSSNSIPLIAVYCIGIFALMMLSLFETIFVMYLMEKDSASDGNEAEGDQRATESGNNQGKANFYSCHRELQKWIPSACVCAVSAAETPCEPLPVAEEDNRAKLMEECQALEKLSGELKAIEKTLALLLNNRKEEEKPGYWTRVAKRFNKVFFIGYVTVVSMFLVFIFLKWNIV
ncbi:uncharacterized protein [Channa argus]|uniref:uncharacterized protein n=1 Tax=Channa argus TaxID=215402 RepID=UPI003523091F